MKTFRQSILTEATFRKTMKNIENLIKRDSYSAAMLEGAKLLRSGKHIGIIQGLMAIEDHGGKLNKALENYRSDVWEDMDKIARKLWDDAIYDEWESVW